ncbi:hypothetical protein [Paraburkholderia agricolaris]|uniref:hypothetical protein n=1 Tax=Paraburkholderia agricolaris TaxID=2152888 RepID=UPI001291A05B|nr:hypothetical protein [Paraburkholderia agricolaris]
MKKSEKNRALEYVIFFSCLQLPLPIALAPDTVKAAKLAARFSVNLARDEPVLRRTDIRISDCCRLACV